MLSLRNIAMCLLSFSMLLNSAHAGETIDVLSDRAEWGFFNILSIGDPLAGLSNVKWSRRTVMSWGKLEKPPGSGRYNWRLMDSFVKEAQKNHYNLIFVLKTGHDERVSESRCYVASSESRSSDKHLHSCPIKPEFESHWQNLVYNIIERYDGDGINDMPGLKHLFRLDIQIENEAGSHNLWYFNERKDGKRAAEEYLNLLRLSYEAKESANPNINIILAGLFQPQHLSRCAKNPNLPFCSSDYSKRNRDFTNEVLKYPQYFDAVDIHLFNYFKFDPYFIRDGIEWLKGQMRKNGYEKPIYSLEWTGSMMMMVKKDGPLKKFISYFPYQSEFRTLKDLFIMYKDLKARKNIRYRTWFESEQAKEFAKIFTTILVNDVKRMIYVRFFDFCGGKGWDNVWWNWQGIIKYEGTRSNPIMIKKPAYYTYNLLSQKLYGFSSARILNAGKDFFAYEFNFKNKKPVYIVWTEGTARSLDFSKYIKSPQAKVTHIVTRLDSANNPICKTDEIASIKAISISETPRFVE